MMGACWARGLDGLLFEPDFATFHDTFMVLWEKEIPGEGSLWKLANIKGKGWALDIMPGKSVRSRVYIRSAMNRQSVMRSEGLTTIAWGALDEPARMLVGQKAFTNTLGRIRNPIPDWKHNPIFMVGSPRGLNHWTADIFGCEKDHPSHGYDGVYESNPQERPGYVIRACRTKDNAKNLTATYESNARITMTKELADQEFNASLMNPHGAVLPEWSRDMHVISNDEADEIWRQRIVSAQGGSDWGTRIQASGASGWTRDRDFLLIDEWYRRGLTLQEQGAAMKEMTLKYGKRRNKYDENTMAWYCETADGGTGAIEMLRKGFDVRGGAKTYLNVQPAKKDWLPGIDLLRNLMCLRTNVFGELAPAFHVAERCKGFIDEAPKYRYKEQEDGKAPPEGEKGADPMCNDHSIDQCRYAAFTTATSMGVKSYSHRRAA